MENDMWKKLTRNVLLGATVVVVTPMITFIPAIFDLKVVTVGVALTAGLVAYGADYLLDQFIK